MAPSMLSTTTGRAGAAARAREAKGTATKTQASASAASDAIASLARLDGNMTRPWRDNSSLSAD
jgi:hypothetical protein